MLLDAIATIILGGMMLIPLVNVIVGAIIGAGLGGPLGGTIGVLLAIAITYTETRLADRLGWRDLRNTSDAPVHAADEAVEITRPSITTGPPSPRRQSNHAQASKSSRRPARSDKMPINGAAAARRTRRAPSARADGSAD